MQERTLYIYRGENLSPEVLKTWDYNCPPIPICINSNVIRTIEVLCVRGYPQRIVEYSEVIANCLHIQITEDWESTAFDPVANKSYKYDYETKEWMEKEHFQNSQQEEYCSAFEE